jgi:hypothetical protein
MVVYDIGKMKQLIDLNGQTTNFDITFNATSVDGSEFDIVVVDQTTLDNNAELNYKKANGTLSGNIISDKNVYQNYFIVLKADKPTKVDITINKKEIPPNMNNNEIKNTYEEQEQDQVPMEKKIMQYQDKKVNVESSTSSSKILFIIIFIILLVLVYFFFIKKSSSSSISSSIPLANESLLARLNTLEF